MLLALGSHDLHGKGTRQGGRPTRASCGSQLGRAVYSSLLLHAAGPCSGWRQECILSDGRMSERASLQPEPASQSTQPDVTWMQPPWGPLGRSLTLGLVSGFAKLVLNVLNTTTVHNHDAFVSIVTERPEGQGLLTVCNHTR